MVGKVVLASDLKCGKIVGKFGLIAFLGLSFSLLCSELKI
jgi:hypothetical protein